jgi:hypothetical protein
MGRTTFDAEYQRLVPQSGNCNTLRGEILRAASKIDYRLYNDGDKVGSGYGHQTCDPAARFLIKKLDGNPKFGFTKTFQNLLDGTYGLSRERYTKLVERMVSRIDRYMSSIPETPNTEDYLNS